MWDPSLPAFTESTKAPILDVKAVAAFSRWYAAKIDLSDPPPGIAPGRAKNLAGVAPAYIGVAGHDPLRDDGIRYAGLLAAAGVPVEVHNAETMVHGYLGYTGVVPGATAGLDLGLARGSSISRCPRNCFRTCGSNNARSITVSSPTFPFGSTSHPMPVHRRP